MSIQGSCKCGNIKIKWHSDDYQLTPRECVCNYCQSKGATYVSKSDTKFEVIIANQSLYHIHQQGTQAAQFHECKGCGNLVFVTSDINGTLFGSINSACLESAHKFQPSNTMELSNTTANQKKNKWQQSWCQPVLITSLGIGHKKPTGFSVRC